MSLHFTIAAPCADELEHGDRRGRHDDALEQVEVHAGVVRDRGLDRVGVRHDDDQLARVLGDHRLERGDHARLHLGERLAAGEAGARRRALHRLPEVGLGQLGDLAAGPLAVVGLDHARQRQHGEPVVLRDRFGGLRGALDRARVDRRDRERRPGARRAPSPARDPVSERSMPGRPAREQRTGLRGDGVTGEHQRRGGRSGSPFGVVGLGIGLAADVGHAAEFVPAQHP